MQKELVQYIKDRKYGNDLASLLGMSSSMFSKCLNRKSNGKYQYAFTKEQSFEILGFLGDKKNAIEAIIEREQLLIEARVENGIKYFAKLDGDLVGIDDYVRFVAADIGEAELIADEKAYKNYTRFEDVEEDAAQPYYAEVQIYNPKEHDEYFGSPEWEESELW